MNSLAKSLRQILQAQLTGTTINVDNKFAMNDIKKFSVDLGFPSISHVLGSSLIKLIAASKNASAWPKHKLSNATWPDIKYKFILDITDVMLGIVMKQ